MPPQTVTEDVRVVLRALRREDVAARWGDGEARTREDVCELVRGALACAGGETMIPHTSAAQMVRTPPNARDFVIFS